MPVRPPVGPGPDIRPPYGPPPDPSGMVWQVPIPWPPDNPTMGPGKLCMDSGGNAVPCGNNPKQGWPPGYVTDNPNAPPGWPPYQGKGNTPPPPPPGGGGHNCPPGQHWAEYLGVGACVDDGGRTPPPPPPGGGVPPPPPPGGPGTRPPYSPPPPGGGGGTGNYPGLLPGAIPIQQPNFPIWVYTPSAGDENVHSLPIGGNTNTQGWQQIYSLGTGQTTNTGSGATGNSGACPDNTTWKPSAGSNTCVDCKGHVTPCGPNPIAGSPPGIPTSGGGGTGGGGTGGGGTGGGGTGGGGTGGGGTGGGGTGGGGTGGGGGGGGGGGKGGPPVRGPQSATTQGGFSLDTTGQGAGGQGGAFSVAPNFSDMMDEIMKRMSPSGGF